MAVLEWLPAGAAIIVAVAQIGVLVSTNKRSKRLEASQERHLKEVSDFHQRQAPRLRVQYAEVSRALPEVFSRHHDGNIERAWLVTFRIINDGAVPVQVGPYLRDQDQRAFHIVDHLTDHHTLMQFWEAGYEATVEIPAYSSKELDVPLPLSEVEGRAPFSLYMVVPGQDDLPICIVDEAAVNRAYEKTFTARIRVAPS